MEIDIDKEHNAFVTAYRLWCIEAHPYGHPEMVHSMAHSHWGRAAGAMWLAAKRHAAEVAEPVETAQRNDCRMTGGICSCRSGGSYGGCRKERDACCSTFAPAAPSGASVEGDARDAARYRWLREHWFLFGTAHSITTTLGLNLHRVNNAGDVATLDASIDAAMSPNKEG